MITIYSDDPRGVHNALKEERAKNPDVQIHVKRRKKQDIEKSDSKAPTEQEEHQASDIRKMTKKQLQEALNGFGVDYEGDANKDRLIELLEGLV